MNQRDRDRDYDEVLRRALHAAADSVEPADDGLQRIRSRLNKPHSPFVAWMMTAWADMAGWVLAGWQSALERLGADEPRRLVRHRPAVVLAAAVVLAGGGAAAPSPPPRPAGGRA